jgi:5-methylcytosine-specific restriction enzyme subunit McrC
MGRIPHRSENCKRELYRAQGLFGAVKRLRFSPASVPEVVFTRLNRHYQPAVALATILLRSGSLDLGGGGTKACAFLVDMNDVFERFVRSALRTALHVDTARFPDRAPMIRLDEKDVIPLKPDLCLLDRQHVIWVGDVKYKRLPVATYLNADLYQLLAYAVALDLPYGTLIYAADEGITAAKHVVRNGDKELRVIALDLSSPWRKLLEQINDIAQCIPLSGSQPVRSGGLGARRTSYKTGR